MPLVLDLSVRQLYGFAAVASTLSYARAAEQLHYTEPGLYVLVKRLGRTLGCKLFERDGRGLRLTQEGSLLLPYCRSMLGDLERMNQVRQNISSTQRLTVVAGPSTGSFLLPDLIRAFEKEEPQIAVQVLIRQIEDVIDLVANGGADVGIAGGINRFPLPEHLSLNCWVEQPGSLLAGHTLPMVPRGPVVVYVAHRDPTMPSQLRQRLEELNISTCEMRALPSTDAVKGACIAGLGYAMLPRLSAMLELQAGILHEVPGFTFPGQVWVCQPLEQHQSPATRLFLRYLHGRGTSLALSGTLPVAQRPTVPPPRALGELSEDVWEKIRPLLPIHAGRRGRRAASDRLMLEGMLWVHETGRRWRDLPERFGPWQTAYGRFAFWRSRGVWDLILRELQWPRASAGAKFALLKATAVDTVPTQRRMTRPRRDGLLRARTKARRHRSRVRLPGEAASVTGT